MATQASPAASQRIKVNPKSASSHGSTGSKHPPRPLNKSNSVQLPNTPHRPSPSPTVASSGGGKAADRRKQSNMNGNGPGRGKTRPGAVEAARRTTVDMPAPSRAQTADGDADVVVLSQPRKKLSPQPFVRTTGYILQKFKGYPPSLVLHLHPTHFRFDGQDGSFSYTSPMRSLLEYIRNETIPPEAVEEFRDNSITYYEGCLIVQIFDHRSSAVKNNKDTAQHGQSIAGSIHKQNDYLTPSPFVPHPMKDTAADTSKVKEEGSSLKPSGDEAVAQSQESKTKIFTTVLHPTPASIHAEIQMLASTPMPPMRSNSITRVGAEAPATPTALTINTSHTGRSAKRQKMWLDDQSAIPFEAKFLQVTNASLILTPATTREHAQKILNALRHPAHNAPPPKPKTRKRTTAELAADEAQAAEEERLLLIMDERHQPAPVAGGAPVSAVGANDGATGGAFEPSFKKWKMIEQIKAKKAEEKRLLEQQRANTEKTAAGAAAKQNAEMERKQREQRDKEMMIRLQGGTGKGPMNVALMQGVQGMVQQHQMQQAQAAAAAAAAAQQLQALQAVQQAQQAQTGPPQQAQPQATQQGQQPPQQPPQASQPQPSQQQQQPQSQPQQPQQQQQIPGQMQFNSNMQPQPPQQQPSQPTNAMQPPPSQQQQQPGNQQQHQHGSPPPPQHQQLQTPQQNPQNAHSQPSQPNMPIAQQQQVAMMRAAMQQQAQQHARMAAAGSPQLAPAQHAHIQQRTQAIQAQQQAAQAQAQAQANSQNQTPRLTAASPNLAQRSSNNMQQLRGATPQPGHPNAVNTSHSIAPHQSPAMTASQPISLQSSPHLSHAHHMALNNAANAVVGNKPHPNINIKPNPQQQSQGQLGQQQQGQQPHPNQSPNIAMSSPNPNMIAAGNRAMHAARNAAPYIKGMRPGPGVMMGPGGVPVGMGGMQHQLTQQQMHQLQQAQQAQAHAMAQGVQQFGGGNGGGQVMPAQFQDLGFALGGIGRGGGGGNGGGQGGAGGMTQQQVQQHNEQQVRQQQAMIMAQAQAQQLGMVPQGLAMNGMNIGANVPQAMSMQGMQGMMTVPGGQNFMMMNNGMGGVVNVPVNAQMMNLMNGQGMGRGRGG